jgi:alanyl-tRNA synthetase
MKSSEIRKKYLEFYEERGHKVVASASLLPENDPTTLFTGSGMQPMVPYLLGEKYPGGETRIANSQKCFRSGDIEEVGDNRHTTFFEMLGNWSLGDYFKKEQIPWMFEFLTKEIGLDPKRIYVSVYRGNEKLGLPREEEAVKLWQEQFKDAGIEAGTVDLIELRQQGIDLRGKCLTELEDSNRIFYYPDSENWWSRAGAPGKMPVGEPGGPDSEMFWDFGPEHKMHENSEWADQPCHPACDCGRFMEIGNNVFMQYKKTKDGFKELEQKNIDFGGGLERIAAAAIDTPDVFLTDLFELPMKKLEELTGKKYNGEEQQGGRSSRRSEVTSDGRGGTSSLRNEKNEQVENSKQSFRVILDHIKGATFLINDGASPSNKDQGYFTRRLIRRAVRFGHQLGVEQNFTKEIAESVIETYKKHYTDLKDNQEKILDVIEAEEIKFRKTLKRGLVVLKRGLIALQKEVRKLSTAGLQEDKGVPLTDMIPLGRQIKGNEKFSGKIAFDLYQSYGFPLELTIEELKQYHPNIVVNLKEFEEELQKHKDLSRTASAGKFKGGLAGDDETTTQLHTVTHLMLAGLRKVLGEGVAQKGSNITPERIRFDFSFDRAMTDEEKQAVEKFVNDALQSGAKVDLAEMPKQQAIDEGVTGAFWEKYPDQVKVYTIANSDGTTYSRELCGGPHIKELSEVKGQFKIQKEKSSSAGVRRIKAVVTNDKL